MHTMKIQPKYYRLLKSGEKRIELRLFDEKRQKIKVGDEIIFSDLSDATENFKAVVVQLYRAESFEALCAQILPQQAGFKDKEELLTVMQRFYPIESQKQFGVVGIEIKKI